MIRANSAGTAGTLNPGFSYHGSGKELTDTTVVTLKSSSASNPEPRDISAKRNPILSKVRVPENCGGCGWKSCAHHCAKLFVMEVEISGLSSEPTVEIPLKKDFVGEYRDEPGRLQSKVLYQCDGERKEALLNLGVATIEAAGDLSAESPKTWEKNRVGLQHCRVGAHRTVALDWIEGTGADKITGNPTGTALVKFKVRARRIRQLKSKWEFKDDAGSGIRGKPHTSSAFRFWACLQKANSNLDTTRTAADIIDAAITLNDGSYMCQELRVWSKGNCPVRVRKSSNSPPATEKQAVPAAVISSGDTAQPMKREPSSLVLSTSTAESSSTLQSPSCSTEQKRKAVFPNASTTMPYTSSDYLINSSTRNKRIKSSAVGVSASRSFSDCLNDVCATTLVHSQRQDEEEDDELSEIDYIINSLTRIDDARTDDSGDDASSTSSWSPLAFDAENHLLSHAVCC